MKDKAMTPKEIQLVNKQIGIFMGWTVEIWYNWIHGGMKDHARTHNSRTNTVHHAYYPFGRGCNEKSHVAVVRYLWQQLCNDTYGDCGKYHKDWHLLMQVVDLIETKNNGLDGIYGTSTTPLMVDIERLNAMPYDYRCSIMFNQLPKISVRSASRIEAVWLAVGEFAKWYNEITLTREYIIIPAKEKEE